MVITMAKLRMAHASRLGQKKKEEEDGDNNGQATHGARKHAWRTQAAWAKMQKRREKRRKKYIKDIKKN